MPRLRPEREARYPNLTPTNYSVASVATDEYNCIAYAYGLDDRPLWPGTEDAWWPPGVSQADEMPSFIDLFESVGYERCADAEREDGFEKVAIYADSDGPTHAAIQRSDGSWTSKLGDWEDIEHSDVHAVEDYYGTATVFMRRSLLVPPQGA